MGEPGGLPCMGSHGVGHDWSDLAAAAAAAAAAARGILQTLVELKFQTLFQMAILKFAPFLNELGSREKKVNETNVGHA